MNNRIVQIAPTFNGGLIVLLADGQLYERVGAFDGRKQDWTWKRVEPPPPTPATH